MEDANSINDTQYMGVLIMADNTGGKYQAYKYLLHFVPLFLWSGPVLEAGECRPRNLQGIAEL